MPINHVQNPSTRLIYFSLLLLSSLVLLLILNVYFLFIPENPFWVNVSNFAIWGLILCIYFYCKDEKRLFISANIITFFPMLVVLISMYYTGGLYSVDKAYLVFLICAAFLFIGNTAGLIYSIFALSGISFYFISDIYFFLDASKNIHITDSNYVYSTFVSVILISSLVLYLLVKIINQLEKENKKLSAENIALLQKKLDIKTQEFNVLKEDLGKDFHDLMGNKLAAISSISQMINLKKDISPIELNQKVKEINSLSKEVYDGTKDFIWSLDNSHSNLLEVYIYLKEFAERLFDSSNLDFLSPPIDFELEKANLSHLEISQIILICKEAFTNVLVHAKASKVQFYICTSNDCIVFIIEDDGKGFEINTLSRINGINNMKSRAQKADLLFEILSKPNQGSILKISYIKR